MVNSYFGYNLNLNQELSAYGTMSRLGNLLNTGNSCSIGNFLGGFGNILGCYGQYGFGGGSYGLGNAMFNFNNMFGGWSCRNNRLYNIAYSFGSIATTFLGTIGLSALANRISARRSQAAVKPETLESVERDLSAQLKILGLDDLTPSVDSKESITVMK